MCIRVQYRNVRVCIYTYTWLPVVQFLWWWQFNWEWWIGLSLSHYIGATGVLICNILLVNFELFPLKRSIGCKLHHVIVRDAKCRSNTDYFSYLLLLAGTALFSQVASTLALPFLPLLKLSHFAAPNSIPCDDLPHFAYGRHLTKGWPQYDLLDNISMNC